MADGRGLRIRNALLAWDRLAAFPVGMCRAAEPVLKEQIYKKSSCEFSFFFFLLELEGGAKTNLKLGTPLIRLERCGPVSQTTAKHRGNISWQR